ncbi:hypothetical protein HYY71_06085 [Candidatus Woesearchaeota archaeon]|nr:hypothetical protein [Candidatus Woesearchaeota archaeon]
MSKLTRLLKYETGLDILPGTGRAVLEMIAGVRDRATQRDYVDFLRMPLRLTLTVGEIADVVKEVSEEISRDRYDMAVFKLLAVLSAYESVKFLVDRGAYQLLRRVYFQVDPQ